MSLKILCFLFVVGLELRVFWKVHNVCRDRVVSVGYDKISLSYGAKFDVLESTLS